NDPDKDNTENEANPIDLKKARDELTRAQATLQQPVTAVSESAIATATALKKKPADMTAADISDAIAAVEQAIADGQTNLLPAAASRWQRAMYALKLALLELGGVDPQLVVKDKATLEDLIKTQQGNPPVDPATNTNVRKAIADANQVQADIAPRMPARQPQKPPEHPALEKLKATQPEDMTAEDIVQEIAAIDTAIAAGETDLLPADASKWQKALQALRLALFELGGIDPDLAVQNRDELIDLIAERQGQPTTDPETREKIEQAIADMTRFQSDIADRNTRNSDYPALDVLRHKKLNDLSTEEVQAAIADIDRSIEDSTVLLPENASRLQWALYALKLALLNLGNVNPKLQYEVQKYLKEILKARRVAKRDTTSSAMS
ncbi:MAG: hypothetical protein AAFW75_33575, partial [Cyanobacteria bacterium J06636_16]